MPSFASSRTAFSPSAVSGHFTTMLGAIFARSRPSRTIPGASVATTSAEIGPSTSAQIFAEDVEVWGFLLREEARVRGDAVDEAERSRFTDLVHACRVEKDFHGFLVLSRKNDYSTSGTESRFNCLASGALVGPGRIVDGGDGIEVRLSGLRVLVRVAGLGHLGQELGRAFQRVPAPNTIALSGRALPRHASSEERRSPDGTATTPVGAGGGNRS